MDYPRHYDKNLDVNAKPNEVFEFIDDHMRLSSHMGKSSWMMFGGKMETEVDESKGQKVGSHIKMSGKILGINLYLDEVVVKRNPPYLKLWKTVGNIRLLVIGHYQMGVEIEPKEKASNVKVFIDYELPKGTSRILGLLFGDIYAKWCVHQMLSEIKEMFKKA